MAMRLDVEFDHPLGADERLQAQLAVAGLAKSKRLYFQRGDYGLVIIGEAMSILRVREAFAELGLQPQHIASSLDDDEDAEADDVEVTSSKERLRAIGR